MGWPLAFGWQRRRVEDQVGQQITTVFVPGLVRDYCGGFCWSLVMRR
jgi:hypothetical protein